MKTTAAEFKRNPQKHYRAADNGEIVTINHDRYRDVVFELIARERNKYSFTNETISTKDFKPGEKIQFKDDVLTVMHSHNTGNEE